MRTLSRIGVNTHAYTHFHFSFKEKRRENNMLTPSSHRHSLVTAPLRVRPAPLLPLLRPSLLPQRSRSEIADAVSTCSRPQASTNC